MANEVTLADARRRVAYRMHAPAAPWSADDVRWLTGHWGLFRRELDLCRRMEEELMELERTARPWWWLVAHEVGGGLSWWWRDAPVFARLALAFGGLFLATFMWGWL